MSGIYNRKELKRIYDINIDQVSRLLKSLRHKDTRPTLSQIGNSLRLKIVRFIPLPYRFATYAFRKRVRTREFVKELENNRNDFLPDEILKLKRNLFAAAVGKSGKKYIQKIVETFGHDSFDYIFFVWDDTVFDEELFSKCTFIYERGVKWHFMKKYLTPERVASYRYIFAWDDDIDIENFSWKHFLSIMDRNALEVAQPALSLGSQITHAITEKQPERTVGRFTDFTEIMVQVFRQDAWIKFRSLLEDWNEWGYGYDMIMKDACGFSRMGIIDAEAVLHTKPVRHKDGVDEAMRRLYRKHRKARLALHLSYADLL